jgi:hypothetical protein
VVFACDTADAADAADAVDASDGAAHPFVFVPIVRVQHQNI